MKKGQTQFKFTRPMSNMRRVLLSVEQGDCTQRAIAESTGLFIGKVRHALKNLCTHGMATKVKDEVGRYIYIIPGSRVGVAKNLKGVSSIFNVR